MARINDNRLVSAFWRRNRFDRDKSLKSLDIKASKGSPFDGTLGDALRSRLFEIKPGTCLEVLEDGPHHAKR